MENKQSPTGYLSRPASGAGPGVLLLHAWWGLNDDVKAACDRLADAGFIAYAPDLYHGRIAQTIAEAEQLSGELHEAGEAAESEVAAAAEYVWALAGSPERGIGVIGFSLGAAYALQLSGSDPERVRAVVVYYGCGEGDFARARATYLGHFAADDPYEPPENVAWLESALGENGRSTTFHHYPGTGHWFCEPGRPDAYQPAAAQLAWQRTLTFLQENLSS